MSVRMTLISLDSVQIFHLHSQNSITTVLSTQDWWEAILAVTEHRTR